MAQVKRWRCANTACGTSDFVADVPVCPGCGVDGRVPRYRGIIMALVTVHFDPPDPLVPRMMGTGRLACDPSKSVAGNRASGDHSAVTCEACRATEVFLLTFGENMPAGQAGIDDPDVDAVVRANPKAGTLELEPVKK